MKKPNKKNIKIKANKFSLKDYALTFAEIKKQVQAAQVKSILAANKELIKLYWSIGNVIVERQKKNGWGSNVIEKLANDLQNAFPGMKGFSRSNVFYMKAFYLAYEKVQKPSGQLEDLPFFNIPWWHNIILITKI